jgi:hypothetical protein
MNDKVKRVLIFGSCVSRDAFENKIQGLELVGYYARSSFASFTGAPFVDNDLTLRIESSFQQRMVQADLEKTFLKILEQINFDVLLIDLIDERFNLIDQGDNRIATISNEYLTAAKLPLNGRVIYSGSSEHIQKWREGFGIFFSIIKKLGWEGRVRINEVFWAKGTESGEKLSSYLDEQIDSANSFLEDRYNDLREILPSNAFISYSADNFVAYSKHKWGISPFHYVPSLYEETISALKGKHREISPSALFKTKKPLRIGVEIKNEMIKAQVYNCIESENTEYAFYLMHENERISMKWYTKDPFSAFEIPVGKSNIHVVAFVRNLGDVKPVLISSNKLDLS